MSIDFHTQLCAVLNRWVDGSMPFAFLMLCMGEYRSVANAEVTASKNVRGLEIHNTVRLAYEKQIELIDAIIDAYEDEEADEVRSLVVQLQEALDDGEIIG